MIWFSSDHHFGHKNIIEYCNRPYANAAEMDADLVRRWNECVSDDDTVYYLGDFSLSLSALHFVKDLKGSKILIAGNHDKCWGKKAEKFVPRYIEAGFAEVHLKPICFEDFLLWHLPYRQDPNSYVERYLEKRLEDKGQWLLHGHVHQHWIKRDRQINVGCDRYDFKPVSLDRVKEIRDFKGDIP